MDSTLAAQASRQKVCLHTPPLSSVIISLGIPRSRKAGSQGEVYCIWPPQRPDYLPERLSKPSFHQQQISARNVASFSSPVLVHLPRAKWDFVIAPLCIHSDHCGPEHPLVFLAFWILLTGRFMIVCIFITDFQTGFFAFPSWLAGVPDLVSVSVSWAVVAARSFPNLSFGAHSGVPSSLLSL